MGVLRRIAGRGLGDGQNHAWFFRLAIFLAVTVLVGVAASAVFFNGLVDRDARALLAADLRLQSSFPLDGFIEAEQLRRPGRTLAKSLEFAAMARIPGSDRSLLVEVKAVAPVHPLRGRVELAGGDRLTDALQGNGLVVEKTVLSRLGLAIGDSLELGEAVFVIRDTLVREPDRVMKLFNLGPKVIMPLRRVDETGLLRFGSRVKHVVSIRLAEKERLSTVARDLKKRVRGRGIRLLTPSESQPSVRRFMRRFSIFLGLTALLTLLVSGLAMAGSMAAHLRESRRNIAILKCLGADNPTVFRLFVLRTLGLALPGSLAGAAVGVLLPGLFSRLLGGLFPDPPPFQINPGILLGGVVFGLLISLVFAIGPLVWTRHVSPGALFRATTWSETLKTPGRHLWPSALVGILLPGFGVAHWSGETRFGLLFAAGLVACLLLAFLVARGGLWLLARLRLPGVPWRLAAKGLVRQGSGNISVIVSLGLGLGVVFAILFLENNLTRQLDNRLPARAPSFFFIDIQPDQVDPFTETIEPFVEDPGATRITPVVRGRLVAIGEQRITPETIAAHPQSWRFTRQYVLTWSREIPKGNQLVAGSWWADGEKTLEASVERRMADQLGLKIGDTLTYDIQGVPVSARIRNIRRVRWADLGLNFFVVFSPSVLAGAPMTHLATVVVPPEREEALLAAVTRRLHNVTAIASREIMTTIKELLQKLSGAIRFLGVTTVVAGLLVLGVGVAASGRRRARESAICRLVGASRWEMFRAAAVEFALVAGLSSLAGLVIGQTITALVIRLILDDQWAWYPGLMLFALTIGAGVVFFVGLLGSYRQLGRPVREVLYDHD